MKSFYWPSVVNGNNKQYEGTKEASENPLGFVKFIIVKN